MAEVHEPAADEGVAGRAGADVNHAGVDGEGLEVADSEGDLDDGAELELAVHLAEHATAADVEDQQVERDELALGGQLDGAEGRQAGGGAVEVAAISHGLTSRLRRRPVQGVGG